MVTEVVVPPLGQTVDTVTLVAWYKREGESVVQGNPLFAIETDKATLDVESPASGVLRQVQAQPGDSLQVLSTIALVAAPDEVLESPAQPHRPVSQLSPKTRPQDTGHLGDRAGRLFISPRARRLAEEHEVPLEALSATGPQGAIVERDVRRFLDAGSPSLITPVARRMAEEAGLDWHGLRGSGPGGRITQDDVSRAIEPASQTGTARAGPLDINEVAESIPVRGVRAVVAGRLLRSATTTAQVSLTSEADATALVLLRRQLIRDGVAVSYHDLFLYILGRVLREHPQLNASLEGDTIKHWRRIHLGLAVETDRGLLVPVVRDVDRLGLIQLADQTRSLVESARAGQCTPEELSGGTFTLTNLGMYGIDAFTPLINPPECAVLGVGRIKRQPVMFGNQVRGREMVWLSLTFDHRLVDGGPAARFLQRVAHLVERPHLLLS